jgi:hypothetical protein
MSDSTPTERFNSPVAQEPTTTPPGQSRRALYILIGVGAALLVAIIILVIVLLTRGDGTPTAAPAPSVTPTVSETPSDTPSPTPSETEAESDDDGGGSDGASSDPRFTVFDAPSKVSSCSMGGPGADPFRPMVTVTWNSASAVSAWYVNGTSDAADSAYMQIPLAGDQTDFEYDQEFPCSQTTASFTITLVGKDGSHVNKTWTVQNTGDVF